MAAFCSSLIFWHPGKLLRYCVSDFEMVPLPPYYYWYHVCFHTIIIIIIIIIV